jgi:small glutamine-rich tetratricopeptide repeat-containing protein alpha
VNYLDICLKFLTAVSKDELCGQFFAVLEKKRYFRTNIDGGDDIVQLEKASRLFDDGFMV